MYDEIYKTFNVEKLLEINSWTQYLFCFIRELDLDW